MSEIKYEFTPFNEEQLEAAVKRLAFYWATYMGWVPKEVADGEEIHQESGKNGRHFKGNNL